MTLNTYLVLPPDTLWATYPRFHNRHCTKPWNYFIHRKTMRRQTGNVWEGRGGYTREVMMGPVDRGTKRSDKLR